MDNDGVPASWSTCGYWFCGGQRGSLTFDRIQKIERKGIEGYPWSLPLWALLPAGEE